VSEQQQQAEDAISLEDLFLSREFGAPPGTTGMSGTTRIVYGTKASAAVTSAPASTAVGHSAVTHARRNRALAVLSSAAAMLVVAIGLAASLRHSPAAHGPTSALQPPHHTVIPKGGGTKTGGGSTTTPPPAPVTSPSSEQPGNDLTDLGGNSASGSSRALVTGYVVTSAAVAPTTPSAPSSPPPSTPTAPTTPAAPAPSTNPVTGLVGGVVASVGNTVTGLSTTVGAVVPAVGDPVGGLVTSLGNSIGGLTT
jgi:hypothetical protein